MTCDHFLPFQCRISLSSALLVEGVYSPTAQQLPDDVQNTPLSSLKLPGFGTLRPPAGRLAVLTPVAPGRKLAPWRKICASAAARGSW